ncbi:MAG: sigma-70 family RNA polymerase sigma factor [Acidobacteria bacterium]|nr:MAG: sigma-70 family RNA polymerase sigma factor [Acidobacteriota bacterium]
MREAMLTDVERIGAFGDAERTFLMTEEAFRVFYEQTSRPVWAYLARITGDGRLADDLLQEAYYRFLRTRANFESDDHRRNYLFRIATNLVVDHRRRCGHEEGRRLDGSRAEEASAGSHEGDRAVRRLDLARAMEQMKPRERSLLWLAYAQGFSHEEIADVLGLKKASLKALLFRARKRLIGLLGTTDIPGDRR